ncbi:MAG: response regulator [Candidatus Micrarchaeales archaeon]
MEKIEAQIFNIIEEKQEISYNELRKEIQAKSLEVDENKLREAINLLENLGAVGERRIGNMQILYSLQPSNFPNKILIVEDDVQINRLMAISIGKGFNILQSYNGREAMETIRKEKPDLIVLDLMLPEKDGLDICNTIRHDPELKNIKIIVVSALDATSHRLKSLERGADYYIKKPFDPYELRTLVNIFLRKKGKKFDPLVDLPDEERISTELENALQEDFQIIKISLQNLSDYEKKFGEKEAMVVIRLLSQLLQDEAKKNLKSGFIGYLKNREFVISGKKEDVAQTLEALKKEFDAVLPFIYQEKGYLPIEAELTTIFESEKVPKLELVLKEIPKEELLSKRKEILGERKFVDIGSYTYEELQKMLGNGVNVVITRGPYGVQISVTKEKKEEKGEEKQEKKEE